MILEEARELEKIIEEGCEQIHPYIAQIQSFLSNCRILLSDTVTADLYGNIKAALMLKGKPIPENDIWIAATARQHNLPLFTK